MKHTCFSGSVIPMKKTKGIRFSLQGKLLFPVVIALTLFMGSSALFLSHFLTEKTEERFVTILSAGNEILVKNIRNATESYKSVMRTISIIPQLKLLADVASDRAKGRPSNGSRTSTKMACGERRRTSCSRFPIISRISYSLLSP